MIGKELFFSELCIVYFQYDVGQLTYLGLFVFLQMDMPFPGLFFCPDDLLYQNVVPDKLLVKKSYRRYTRYVSR